MRLMILLFVLMFLSLSNLLGQQKKEVEMTYFHKIPLEKLYIAGDKLRFIQLCTISTDSIVNGTIIFKKSSIATIEDCKVTMRIITDTIRSFEVLTSKKIDTEHLIDETMKVYGKPNEVSAKSGTTTYGWTKNFQNQICSSSLIINEKKHTAVLQSKLH